MRSATACATTCAVLAALALVLGGCGESPLSPAAASHLGGVHCNESEGGRCTKCVEPYRLVGGRCFYRCTSDLELGPLVKSSVKGIALDDTTHHWCPDQIPSTWPNTDAPIKSIRIFKAWQTGWNMTWKRRAWEHIASYADKNDAKVLLGTQVSCDEKADDRDWADVKELLQMLGPDRIMGVAIGNELELLWLWDFKGKEECVQRLWPGGYFLRKFKDRVRDLDTLPGFEDTRVTTVFGEFALGPGTEESPFVDDPEKAMVNTFVKSVFAEFGRRYVLTLNIYPYFDINNKLDPNSEDECGSTLARTICFDEFNCLFPTILKVTRDRMGMIAYDFDTLWVGETGWSFPKSKTLSTEVARCPAWSDESALRTYYDNFLKWDMKLVGIKGPDHVFYFTMRDSIAGGLPEYFGLVGDGGPEKLCQNTTCKLQPRGAKEAPRGLVDTGGHPAAHTLASPAPGVQPGDPGVHPVPA